MDLKTLPAYTNGRKAPRAHTAAAATLRISKPALWTATILVLLRVSAPMQASAGRFELLSRTLVQGPVKDAVFFSGGAAFTAGGGIFIATPPYGPGGETGVFLEGLANDLEESGDVIYAVAWNHGLVAIDASDPSVPEVKTVYRTPRASICHAVNGRLYMVEMNKGLLIFDITDPMEPVLEEKIQLRSLPRSITSSGDILALVYEGSFSLYRIAAPGGLDHISDTDAETGLTKGVIEGEILFAFSSSGSFSMWDISSPGSPVPLDGFPLKEITDLEISGSGAYAMKRNGRLIPLEIEGKRVKAGKALTADYSEADDIPGVRLSIVGKLRGERTSRDIPGSFVSFSDSILITYSAAGHVHFFSRKGERLEYISSKNTGGFAFEVTARYPYVFLANGADGIRTGLVSPDGSVEWKGHLQTSVARDLALDGDILVIADGDGGLKIADISDPFSPVLIGEQSSPYYLSAVVAEDGMAYIAGGMGGAEVVDFSDPRHPKRVWRKEMSEVRGVWVSGRRFAFSDGGEGFRIFEMRGGRPAEICHLDTPGWNCDLWIDGDTAYIAEGGHGLLTADISEMMVPKLLGSVHIGTIAREIHARGKTVFIASHVKGITAIDVTDPEHPYISARHPSVDDGRGVFADGRFVYLASGSGGIYIFRYVNPDSDER